jgi:hypothetical protein
VTEQGVQDNQIEPSGEAGSVDAAEGRGSWVSDLPAGPKVCTLRLDSTHLLHTGLGAGWSVGEVQAYFADCAAELIRPRAGGMIPPGEWPTEINGWGEAIRFAQDEFWAASEPQGTTVAFELGDRLWVLTRGDHRVTSAPELYPRPSWGGCLWHLDRTKRWRIEVGLKDGPGTIWTARWQREGDVVPKRPVVKASKTPKPTANPKLRIPYIPEKWRGHAAIGGAVAGLLLVIALLFAAIPKEGAKETWLWVGDFAAARYRAQITSYPEGAKILVDGEDTALETPAEVVLTRGAHRIEMNFGEYGGSTSQLEGGRGERLTHHVDLLGRLIVANADTSVVLYARLDGEPIDQLPAILDSVPVGRRQLSFQGRDVHPWTEEVDVVVGGTTQFVARPERVPDKGVVVARAYTVNADGLEEVKGAAIYLDGEKVGWTPARLEVSRGFHTVRLVSSWARSPVQLLRVDGGGELFATAEFGRSPEPEVMVDAAKDGSLADPPLVRAYLSSTGPIRIRRMRFFWRPQGDDFKRMTMVTKTTNIGVVGEVIAPLENFEPWSRLEYFIVIESDQGEEFVSEIQRIRVLS